MKTIKKAIFYGYIYSHFIKYIFMVLLSALAFQIFTNQILSGYELFLATNYADLLLSLFSAQVTIIILPLSLFGIFTEISNEVYLGQSIAEYMYMYKGKPFFAFRYKELAVSSMLLTLTEYILMSKKLLAAELMVLVLNTIAMLVSLFSWFEIRIRKEELHAFIKEQLYMKLNFCMKQGISNTFVIKFLSQLKDWVVNGGDYEMIESMEFYKNLNIRRIFWDMAAFTQNKENEEYAKGLLASYQDTDFYFDEMVTDLLRKQDYYRALRCSKGKLEVIAKYRVNNYYHPNHYHYRILLSRFRKMSEMEIELLGKGWFYDYLITILKNGNAKNCLASDVQTEGTGDLEELQCIREESYILAYEFLMSIWQNDNLQPEYKQKQLNDFLYEKRWEPAIMNSALCVGMKLMETKEQKIIDMVVEKNWNEVEIFFESNLSKEKDEGEFLEKSMVLILAYGYYLAVHKNHNIIIPNLKIHIANLKLGIMEEYYMWEVLSDCAWKCFGEINEFLARNCKLDMDFRYRYYEVIYEIMLYSAMVNKQWPIPVKNNKDAYNQVIRHFRYLTSNIELIDVAISRYKKFIELFGARDKITDQSIDDQFYEFKKLILQYYMESLKKKEEKFDKNAFWEDLKAKVWGELIADPQFETSLSNVQISSEDSVDEALYICPYLVLPYEGKYNANEIKEWLCGILRKNAGRKGTGSQELTETYNVLSLEWTDEALDDKEIEYFIQKNQGFDVQLYLDFRDRNNIFSMNFRTYEEAYEFVMSEYKKVVFRMKVKSEIVKP